MMFLFLPNKPVDFRIETNVFICIWNVRLVYLISKIIFHRLIYSFTTKQVKGPDRNRTSPIKWCKWPVWKWCIYFRHPMGSPEAFQCQFFFDQSDNFFSSQHPICWICNVILHTRAKYMTDLIKINLFWS